MFDRYVAPAPRRRWVGAAIVLSTCAHLVVGGALTAAAMWRIDRLAPEARPLTVLAAAPVPAPAASAPAAAPRTDATPTPQRRVRPRALTQPSAEAAPDIVEDHGDGGGEGTGDGPGGFGSGDGDGLCCGLGPGGPGTDLIGDLEVRPPKPEPPQEPQHVAPQMIEGQRIAGSTQIAAPESVQVDMLQTRTEKVLGTIKMCLDDRGRVASLTLLRSTGYPAYDQRLLAEMQRWRYRPYEVGGQAIAVCTPVTFIYRLQR